MYGHVTSFVTLASYTSILSLIFFLLFNLFLFLYSFLSCLVYSVLFTLRSSDSRHLGRSPSDLCPEN